MSKEARHTSKLGIFRVGEFYFSLPVEHVGEVAPFTSLTPLITPFKGIIGQFNLRGWSLPVLDLSYLLQNKPITSEKNIVLLVRWKQSCIGLLLSEILNLQDVNKQDIAAFDNSDTLLQGTFYCQNIARSVSHIDLELMTEHHELPWVAQNARDQNAYQNNYHRDQQNEQMVMVFSVANSIFCLPTRCIQSTIGSTELRSHSVTNGSLYLGEQAHLDEMVPVVDFHYLYFLQAAQQTDSRPQPSACIIIKCQDKHLGLRVERVIDVCAIDLNTSMSKPDQAFIGHQLCQSLIALGDIPAVHASHEFDPQTLCILLDESALTESSQLYEIAKLNRAISTPMNQTQSDIIQQLGSAKRGILVNCGQLMLIDINDVESILDFDVMRASSADNQALVGLIKQNKETISVYDYRCSFTRTNDDTPAKHIIILSSCEAKIGIAVDKLVDIVDYQVVKRDKCPDTVGYLSGSTIEYYREGKKGYTQCYKLAAD